MFNTLSADVFNERLSWANLVIKTDFDAKFSSFSRKITENKIKHLLIQNELNKLSIRIAIRIFDSSYFIGQSHFEEDGAQKYWVFQPLVRYFKFNGSTGCISSWKSKGLSAETIEPPSTSNISISPQFSFYGAKMRVEFIGSCLKQPKISHTHRKVVNIYIFYDLGSSGSSNSDPTLQNCLFSAVTLTKNADIDKYKYSSYGIEFDRRSSFSFPGSGFGQNVLIFGADMSSSAHIDNKKKRHISSRKRTNTRMRTYFNCRKYVLD